MGYISDLKELKLGSKFEKFREIFFEIYWTTIVAETFGWIAGAFGLYQCLTGQWKILTFLWTVLMFVVGGLGITITSHRLYSHRSFKPNRPLKIFLLLMYTIAGQQSIKLWSNAHRAHHKFTQTEKDPTNINRGFLFAHFYWKFWFSPEAMKAMKSIDMSDILSDKDAMFQTKYYYPLHFIFALGFPTFVPYLLWNEAFWVAANANALRWLLNFNQMGFANSLLHMQGSRPYDSRITARENLFLVIYIFGEGYHNFHHVFPWDYRTSEFGRLSDFNLAAWTIDLFHKFGWVTDRKAVSPEMIAKRKARTGDGSKWKRNEDAPDKKQGDIGTDVDDRMDIHAYYKDDYFKDEEHKL